MKKILSTIFTAFLSSSCANEQDLNEFSTSMDFNEFDVVLKHLNNLDSPFAGELKQNIKLFKDSSSPGQNKKIELKSFEGHMVLTREDEYAIKIVVFSTKENNSKLDSAYTKATDELGI